MKVFKSLESLEKAWSLVYDRLYRGIYTCSTYILVRRGQVGGPTAATAGTCEREGRVKRKKIFSCETRAVIGRRPGDRGVAVRHDISEIM